MESPLPLFASREESRRSFPIGFSLDEPWPELDLEFFVNCLFATPMSVLVSQYVRSFAAGWFSGGDCSNERRRSCSATRQIDEHPVLSERELESR